MNRIAPFMIAASLAACDMTGSYRSPAGGNADPAPDADPGAPDADLVPGPDAAVAAACIDPVAPNGSGEHNAGTACQPCHGPAGDAPRWTLGGTLYVDAAGSAPLAGATIRVTDAAGLTIDLATAQNGNFWTTRALTFPITVEASRCPDTRPMIGSVATPGDCNAASCHAAAAPAGRIHLP